MINLFGELNALETFKVPEPLISKVGAKINSLSNPLKKMEKAADRIAKGYYEERICLSGKDEIGRLAGSFNRMADAVEEKIRELSQYQRKKLLVK